MFNIISDSSFNDEIMTNSLQICCNIIDAIEHSYKNNNSNFEIIYNSNTVKSLKRLIGTFLLLNNNFLFTDQFHKLGNEADFFNSFM